MISTTALLGPVASHVSAVASQTEGVQKASGAFTLTWLLVALPLLSAAILLLGGRRTNNWGHVLGALVPWLCFVVAAVMWVAMLNKPSDGRAFDQYLFNWIPAGSFQLAAGLRIDQLSMAFVLLITFVGSLIHTYSVAYMEHDPERRRFFGYMNLFVASMLLLVLADSYLLLFVGWEGVGLASYLLIGFWNYNPVFATAAKKAFVVNRVGDMGLAVAIFLMFATFGTVTFNGVFAGSSSMSTGVATAMGLLLLLGACGKSAQFPLQSWLGDAMAGPTPVSALIHAATMVTAGVYLIVRSSPIFDVTSNARVVVAIVGGITLLFGAIVGCAKDDIKKALAASTMSQIGYMTLAAGLGPVGYVFAIFQLLTHGFFKAGMFLGAGSVMHGMNDQTDMRRFGRLRVFMMITWITFGFGWLAIIGVPPFSGYWSKDKIIEAAFTGSGWQPWVFGPVALIGAGITAFYMSRLFFMTFHGDSRWTEKPEQHPHDPTALMTVPMIILAIGSAGLGAALGATDAIEHWLSPVVGAPPDQEPVISVTVLAVVTLVLVLIGGAWAWMRYGAAPVPEVAPVGSFVTQAARQDLYQDSVNEALLMRPGEHLTRSLVFVDGKGVDGAVGGLAALIGGLSARMRRLQNGFVRSYALTMLAGVVVVLGALAVIR